MGKQFYVYLITNIVNGKVYVGKSTNPRKRWAFHVYSARHGCPFLLHRAIRKYGKEAFVLSTLGVFENEADSFAFEREQIKLFGATCRTRGYNITTGGEGASGKPMSPKVRAAFAAWNASDAAKESRRKMNAASVAARKGKPLSVAHKEKVRAGNLGKIVSEETGRKISEAKRGKDPLTPEQHAASAAKRRGRKQSPEAVAKIVAGLIGRRLSQTTRDKIALAHTGMKATIEARDKMRAAKLGRVLSSETRMRMSMSMRNAKATTRPVAMSVNQAFLLSGWGLSMPTERYEQRDVAGLPVQLIRARQLAREFAGNMLIRASKRVTNLGMT